MRVMSLALAAAVLLLSPAAWAGGWLLTPEEAARITPPGYDHSVSMAAIEGPGPKIVVKDPGLLKEVFVPVDILVLFEPGESGLAPDMKSLRVNVIGFIDLDITDRVAKYVVENRLDVQKAELPTGKHRLRLSIKDQGGNANERDLNISIKSVKER